MKKLSSIGVLSFTMAGLFVLTACDSTSDVADLQQYMLQLKGKSVLPSASLTQVELTQSMVYEASALRNPFKMDALDKPAAGHARQPLEGVPLTTLRFIGTLSRGKQNWAIMMTPDGKVFQAGAGDLIGEQEGRVARVTPTEIEIAQQFLNEAGQKEQRSVILKLEQPIKE